MSKTTCLFVCLFFGIWFIHNTTTISAQHPLIWGGAQYVRPTPMWEGVVHLLWYVVNLSFSLFFSILLQRWVNWSHWSYQRDRLPSSLLRIIVFFHTVRSITENNYRTTFIQLFFHIVWNLHVRVPHNIRGVVRNEL